MILWGLDPETWAQKAIRTQGLMIAHFLYKNLREGFIQEKLMDRASSKSGGNASSKGAKLQKIDAVFGALNMGKTT